VSSWTSPQTSLCEEAVGPVFTDDRAKGKAKREDQDEGPSSRQEKRKKDD
jgi:hypothetical protein